MSPATIQTERGPLVVDRVPGAPTVRVKLGEGIFSITVNLTLGQVADIVRALGLARHEIAPERDPYDV